jgi:hypothetical protein
VKIKLKTLIIITLTVISLFVIYRLEVFNKQNALANHNQSEALDDSEEPDFSESDQNEEASSDHLGSTEE